MKLKNKIKFKIVEFLYKYKLFGFHKKCWADLVIFSMFDSNWNDVRNANKCGYCGSCISKEEIMMGGEVNE